MGERELLRRGALGTLIGGEGPWIAVHLEPDRGVVLTLEHDDFALSADEAQQLARAVTHYADELAARTKKKHAKEKKA